MGMSTPLHMYSLFQRDHNKIMNNCLVVSHMRHANLAVSLEGYLWTISSLAKEMLFICCNKIWKSKPFTPSGHSIYRQ